MIWHERRNPRGLFDVRLMHDVSVITAASVGGGSLVYANVQLRARYDVFANGWPAAVTRWATAAACRGYGCMRRTSGICRRFVIPRADRAAERSAGPS
jgi:hypothetical protein